MITIKPDAPSPASDTSKQQAFIAFTVLNALAAAGFEHFFSYIGNAVA
jgi:hypothetical protein